MAESCGPRLPLVAEVRQHCGFADLAYAVAAVSDNLDTANTLVPAYIVTLLFFTGCLLRIPDIPDYARWYSYLNFIRFSCGALMIIQYDDSRPEFLPGINVCPALASLRTFLSPACFLHVCMPPA